MKAKKPIRLDNHAFMNFIEVHWVANSRIKGSVIKAGSEVNNPEAIRAFLAGPDIKPQDETQLELLTDDMYCPIPTPKNMGDILYYADLPTSAVQQLLAYGRFSFSGAKEFWLLVCRTDQFYWFIVAEIQFIVNSRKGPPVEARIFITTRKAETLAEVLDEGLHLDFWGDQNVFDWLKVMSCSPELTETLDALNVAWELVGRKDSTRR